MYHLPPEERELVLQSVSVSQSQELYLPSHILIKSVFIQVLVFMTIGEIFIRMKKQMSMY
ncbi:hypothetical protein SDC9_153282 [bioreactor metagenome]|uniref:Uncharacterized protein n=1 Tax=bioreactor metagenome TaxID=1076179 RepID=A0A645EVF3_9ZZZZ